MLWSARSIFLIFMREPTEEEIYLNRQKILELIERRGIDKRKNAQEYLEAIISQPFTVVRSVITAFCFWHRNL